MKIQLIKAELNGVGTLLNEVTIDGEFKHYYHGENKIDEPLLIQNLPQGFLPREPKNIMLFVESIQNDPDFIIPPKGQTNLKIFLNWHKQHESHLILLKRPK